MLALLKRSRELQVILVVVIAANLASGGMSDVALPSLAHATFGAAGYGALLACFAVGGVAGTLAAARTGNLRAPVMFASAVFLVEAVAIALVPYLGGEAGAAAALCVAGACNGLGNVTVLTVLQKWVSPGLLGRVMGTLMLCSFGSFPLSVAVSGVLVHHFGPAPFFPVAGSLIAVAILGGLTQREFRAFGATGDDSGRAPAVRRLLLKQQRAHANKRPTGGRRRDERPPASSGRRVVLLAGPPASSRVPRAAGRPFGGCRWCRTPRSFPTTCWPPRLRGITWSMVSARRPQ